MRPSVISGMHPWESELDRGACGGRKEPKSRDTPWAFWEARVWLCLRGTCGLGWRDKKWRNGVRLVLKDEPTQCKQMLQRAITSTDTCSSCFVNSGVCSCNLQRLRCKLAQETTSPNVNIISFDLLTYLSVYVRVCRGVYRGVCVATAFRGSILLNCCFTGRGAKEWNLPSLGNHRRPEALRELVLSSRRAGRDNARTPEP
jgi:hypothetical protein